MAITTAQVTALSHRLALIEALLPLIQRLTEPLLAEGVLEATPPDDLVLTREAIATLAGTALAARTKANAPTTAATLSRADVGAAYFQTQQLAAILGQTTRKTAALLAATIEGVPIPKAMKDAWAAGLDSDLAALDAALAALPTDPSLDRPGSQR